MRSISGRVAWFFLLTFGITWGLQLPGVLAQRGLLPGDPGSYLPLAGLGMLGPLLSATWLSFREGGSAAVKRLYAPLLHFRVHWAWYLLALAVPGALLTGLLWLLNLAGRHGPTLYFPAFGALLAGVVISLVEEVGWRGYALPRLQANWGSFAASGLIGVLWYLWHIPMFLGLGVPLDLVFVMLLYFVGASLFLTWIYNATNGSLLLMVLGHLGAHLNDSHRALPGEVVPLVAHAIVYGALGLCAMRSFSRAIRARVNPRSSS
ncbi:MAG TPA: CPBP family intramembrane glutamic endopeptidase [Polyangiaceae bacterium]|nr:CPBP family intramembrane glutamic endopeptidase [Polyangiaceae bacterium]